MPNTPGKYGTPDAESPEWTREKIAGAMRLPDFPPALKAALRPKGTRGPQKAATKQPISLRVSQDVLDAMKRSGPGWQRRADEALRAAFIRSRNAA